MKQRIFDNGICIPIPFLSRWLPGLALRLFRFDLDPRDSRVGVTLQLEWTKPML